MTTLTQAEQNYFSTELKKALKHNGNTAACKRGAKALDKLLLPGGVTAAINSQQRSVTTVGQYSNATVFAVRTLYYRALELK